VKERLEKTEKSWENHKKSAIYQLVNKKVEALNYLQKMGWRDEVKRIYRIDEDKVQMSANYHKVLERDGFTCQDCGRKDNPEKYGEWEKAEDVILVIHHKIPRKDGGKSDIDNLITLCKDCHAKKHPWLADKKR